MYQCYYGIGGGARGGTVRWVESRYGNHVDTIRIRLWGLNAYGFENCTCMAFRVVYSIRVYMIRVYSIHVYIIFVYIIRVYSIRVYTIRVYTRIALNVFTLYTTICMHTCYNTVQHMLLWQGPMLSSDQHIPYYLCQIYMQINLVNCICDRQ